MGLEEEITAEWRGLFVVNPVTEDTLRRGIELLRRLRPESPLYHRYCRELSELKERLLDARAQQEEQSRRYDELARRQAEKFQRRAPPRYSAPASPSQPAAERPAPRPSRPRSHVDPAQLEAIRQQILLRLAAGQIDVPTAQRLMEDAQRTPVRGELHCRISEKGAVSLYGLQRMPVTLYAGQWERLLDSADQLRSFFQQHGDELSRKRAVASANGQAGHDAADVPDEEQFEPDAPGGHEPDVPRNGVAAHGLNGSAHEENGAYQVEADAPPDDAGDYAGGEEPDCPPEAMR